MIDWSIDWRDWFDIQEPDSAALIDWSQCPDAESVPYSCGNTWVVRGTRIAVQDILDTAEECTPEEMAGPDIFPDLTVEQVRDRRC
jgi:hypothetical protein